MKETSSSDFERKSHPLKTCPGPARLEKRRPTGGTTTPTARVASGYGNPPDGRKRGMHPMRNTAVFVNCTYL